MCCLDGRDEPGGDDGGDGHEERGNDLSGTGAVVVGIELGLAVEVRATIGRRLSDDGGVEGTGVTAAVGAGAGTAGGLVARHEGVPLVVARVARALAVAGQERRRAAGARLIVGAGAASVDAGSSAVATRATLAHAIRVARAHRAGSEREVRLAGLDGIRQVRAAAEVVRSAVRRERGRAVGALGRRSTAT